MGVLDGAHHRRLLGIFCMSIDAADMDGTGDLDVVGASSYVSSLLWWENDGNGWGWTHHVITSSLDSACECLVTDLDGDLDPDVVGTSTDMDLVCWYENLGDGSSGVSMSSVPA